MDDAAVLYARLKRPLLSLLPPDRPYALHRPHRYRLRGLTDNEGIPLFLFEGRTYHHPVLVAQQVLADLESYRLGGGNAFLDRAHRSVKKLLTDTIRSREGLYYPYRFDFPLAGNRDDLMVAPWYSAMAQGQVLSAVARLFEVAHHEDLRQAADMTFRTFLNERSDRDPWTVFVDDNGYLWLEEYAKDPPMRVLNGHLFGMFGLFDYHRVTLDQRAATVFQGAAATVLSYGEQFRDPGGVSSYCLRVPTIKSEKYHVIHQEQLRMLSRMTGEASFAEMADRLAADHVTRRPPLRSRIVRRLRRALALGRRS